MKYRGHEPHGCCDCHCDLARLLAPGRLKAATDRRTLHRPKVGERFRNLAGFENDLDRIGIGAIGNASNNNGAGGLLSQVLSFADERLFHFEP